VKKECIKESEGEKINNQKGSFASRISSMSLHSTKSFFSCSAVLAKQKSGSSKQSKLFMAMEQALTLTTTTSCDIA